METANEEARPPRMRQPKELTPPSTPSSVTNTARDFANALAPAAAAATSPRDDNCPTNGSATATDPSPSRTPETIMPPGIIPPYWQHYRNASHASQVSVERPHTPLITLEDHTEDPASETTKGLWAR